MEQDEGRGAVATSLRGRLALVTGAGSGIGRAIALTLAAAGMRLILVGRDAAKLRWVAGQTSGTAVVVPADLATATGIATAAAAAGPALDVLVHSAGLYLHDRILETPATGWETLAAINLHAPMLLTASCLGALRAASGQVVFVNSTAGLRTGTGGAYAVSKHALRAAADALRQQVNADGIRVLSVFPGRTDTPMQDALLAEERRKAEPGMLMRPEDVASMVLSALRLPRSAEVTDITMRPMRPL